MFLEKESIMTIFSAIFFQTPTQSTVWNQSKTYDPIKILNGGHKTELIKVKFNTCLEPVYYDIFHLSLRLDSVLFIYVIFPICLLNMWFVYLVDLFLNTPS